MKFRFRFFCIRKGCTFKYVHVFKLWMFPGKLLKWWTTKSGVSYTVFICCLFYSTLPVLYWQYRFLKHYYYMSYYCSVDGVRIWIVLWCICCRRCTIFKFNIDIFYSPSVCRRSIAFLKYLVTWLSYLNFSHRCTVSLFFRIPTHNHIYERSFLMDKCTKRTVAMYTAR